MPGILPAPQPGRWRVLPLMAAILTATATAGPGPGTDTPAMPPATPSRRVFVRPKVTAARFTPDRTALLEPECARIATFLARYAAEKLTAGVLAGNPADHARGRALLALSLHLQPLNPSAVHCATRWFDAQSPSLPPSGEDVRTFSNFLLSAAGRQSAKPGQSPEVLSRFLIRLAADIDPANEAAVYASEVQDRDGKSPPLAALLDGTLGRDWLD